MKMNRSVVAINASIFWLLCDALAGTEKAHICCENTKSMEKCSEQGDTGTDWLWDALSPTLVTTHAYFVILFLS